MHEVVREGQREDAPNGRDDALDGPDGADRPRETTVRPAVVATGTASLTSLVMAALMGAASAAGAQDLVQDGGGDGAAGVTDCPDEQEGASTNNPTLPETCADPGDENPGGTPPPPETEPPETEPAPEPDPGPDPGPDHDNGEDGVAGPGGRGGRAGGRDHDDERDGGGRHQGDRRNGGEGHRGSGGTSAGESSNGDGRQGGAQSAGSTPKQSSSAVVTGGPLSNVHVGEVDLDGLDIPSFLLPIYRDCGRRYDIPWEVLAAINRVETAFGSNLNVSSAGAVGWMQFMPGTWAAYGVDANGDGRRNPYDPKDAICAAANYLNASGGRDDLRRAIFAYNHADWYVEMVLAYARDYGAAYLPEPLPRATRLAPDFARSLARIARANDVDWALVLAVLRAKGMKGRVPASKAEVRAVAERLASRTRPGMKLGELASRLFRHDELRLRVPALTRYNRAVGLPGLVKGLNGAKGKLQRRVLENERLDIYQGGRDDIKNGVTDVRVLTLLLYLGERFDEVTVTSLTTGHGYYARPGVPSLHSFGRALDIAALDGEPVLGHQQRGGKTQRALRDILLLPRDLQPSELISLFDLGGPSFAAADHHDHIHVGF